MALSDLVVNITGTAQGFKKTLGGVTTGLHGLGSVGTKVSGALKLSFSSLAASIAPLVAAFKGFAFLGESADLARTQIAAERKLGAVLKATGNAAGLTAEEIKNLASARQGLTNFGDEDTINASALLASFKEIKGDTFREAVPLIQDMSEAMGQKLTSSAIQLGKAINDPVAGIGSLSRVGVQFTHAQKELIKSLVEGGEMAKAQGLILNELKSEFGGTAEAMADPLTQAGNAWGDFKEQLGMVWNDIKAAALDAFGFQELVAQSGGLSKAFRQNWLPPIKAGLSTVANLFQNTIGFLKGLWNDWGQTVKNVFQEIGTTWNATIGFLKGLWNDWGPTITQGVEEIKQAFWEAGAAWSKAFNFQQMRDGWGWVADEFRKTWGPIILTGIKKAIELIKDMLEGLKKIGEWLSDIDDRVALHGLKKQGKFLDYNLDQFKAYIKLHKDLDKEIASIDKLLKENQLQTLPTLDDIKGKSKSDPFITEMQGFINNMRTATPTGGVKRQDFANSGVSSSIEAGTEEAYRKIIAATNGKQKKLSDLEKQTAKNTQQTAEILTKVERHLERIERKTGAEKVVQFAG